MRDKYFIMFQEIKNSEYYYFHYRIRSTRIQRIIKAILVLGTSASITTSIILNNILTILVIIIVISQIILAIEHLFPFSKQITTINFFIPDLRALSFEIEYEFDFIDEISENEATEKIYDFHKKYHALEQKYVGDIYFPYNKRCRKKAQKDWDDFYKFKYEPASKN